MWLTSTFNIQYIIQQIDNENTQTYNVEFIIFIYTKLSLLFYKKMWCS